MTEKRARLKSAYERPPAFPSKKAAQVNSTAVLSVLWIVTTTPKRSSLLSKWRFT